MWETQNNDILRVHIKGLVKSYQSGNVSIQIGVDIFAVYHSVIFKEPTVIGSVLGLKEQIQDFFVPVWYGQEAKLSHTVLAEWNEIDVPVNCIESKFLLSGFIRLRYGIQGDCLRLTE